MITTGEAVRAEAGRSWRCGSLVAAAAILATVLSGCTVGRDGDDPGPSGGSGPAGSPAPGEDTSGGDGPSSEELSRALLGARPPTDVLGSGTAPVEQLRGAEVTIEVLEVARTGSGTRVMFQLSTPATAVSISSLTFGGARSDGVYFLHDVLLEDADEAVRYRPLRFFDYRQACVCPYLQLDIDAEPRMVTVLFPPVDPEADRVSVLLGDDGPAVTDLPVSGQPPGS
ncbi:MAG: hypothetical protein ACFCVG_01750 [Kineosporiaceae bacterium]